VAWERLCESDPPTEASASLLASLPLLTTVVIHPPNRATGGATAGPEALVALVRACEQACRAVTVRVLRRPHDEKHESLVTALQGAAQRYVTVTDRAEQE
jgi:hypothetical protein